MSSADFNAFGEDKDGLKAHCFAWFYGPSYIPENFEHMPIFQGTVLPPRYGPPSPQQVPWLPLGWKPNPPPLYYGNPSPPYLPKPRVFDPSVFEALRKVAGKALSQSDSVCRVPDPEVMDGVFSILVTYSSGNGVRRFNMQTDMSWEAFRMEAGIRMGVRQDAGLAYRQFYTITVREGLNDLSGCYGPVLPLLEAEDWNRAMTDLCKAGDELLGVEVELLVVDEETGTPNKEEIELIPVNGLQIKTYFFEYPRVDCLIDQLGYSLHELSAEVPFVDANLIGRMLEQAGIERLDDFALISPQSLHRYEGIPAEAIQLLYSEAEKMIRVVHLEMEQDI